MWEQLSAADSPLVCFKDIDLFVKYHDHFKFMHFMMGLREDFEPTRVSLLNQSPTPSLNAAVKELISKENRRPTYTCHHLIGCTISTASHCCIHCSSMNKLWALSFPKVLAVNFVVPKAMTSQFVTNCKNLSKSRTKLLFLGQQLYVLQIHRFLQVHLWLPHLLQLLLRQ